MRVAQRERIRKGRTVPSENRCPASLSRSFSCCLWSVHAIVLQL